MPAEMSGSFRVGFFGAMTLLGAEVRRQLESRNYPAASISLYDAGESEGAITGYDGEVILVQRPDETLFEKCDLAFICGRYDPRSSDYLDWVIKGGGVALDLAEVTRSRPEVPLVNIDVNPGKIGANRGIVAAPTPVAHPLSTILHRLRLAFPLRGASVTIFRPASEFGEKGVRELHEQAVALFSFSSVPEETLGRQSAFNIFPVSLLGASGKALEERARGDVLRVLDLPEFPLAVRLLQAPIFHGHAYSIHVDLGRAVEGDEVASALTLGGGVTISGENDGRTPAELAAEPGIWIAGVSPAPPDAGCFWIWAVCDAIRSGAALNAARLADRLAEIRV